MTVRLTFCDSKDSNRGGMRSVALLALLFGSGLLACGAPSETGQPKSETTMAGEKDTLKPGAPVEIEAEMRTDGARVTIQFASAARGVEVTLRGTDGLLVQGDTTPVRQGIFALGERLELDVSFVPGPEHCNLAVLVSGDFQGRPQSRAASFTVGPPARSGDDRRGASQLGGLRSQGIKVGGTAQKR